MPRGQHVDQGTEPDPLRVLRQHGVEQQDVGNDLKAVVVKVMLGRPE
jgi:hypothetical protein